MTERDEQIESDLLDKALEKEMKDFKVPVKYREAFNAYYLEFLHDHKAATNPKGTFFDDEDTKRGISQKFTAFYQPIVNMLETKHPAVEISLYIVSEYESNSTIVITAENRAGHNVMDMPVVIFIDYPKAWALPYAETDIKNVYRELSELYRELQEQILKAISLKQSAQNGNTVETY